jgi:sec-independent protein translocase protein TatA
MPTCSQQARPEFGKIRSHTSLEITMGIGIWELVLLFMIVLLLFGTKRLRNIGGDLGSAIKSFRSAMNEPDNDKTGQVIDAEATTDKDKQNS